MTLCLPNRCLILDYQIDLHQFCWFMIYGDSKRVCLLQQLSTLPLKVYIDISGSDEDSKFFSRTITIGNCFEHIIDKRKTLLYSINNAKYLLPIDDHQYALIILKRSFETLPFENKMESFVSHVYESKGNDPDYDSIIQFAEESLGNKTVKI